YILENELESKVKPILQIHDELLYEVEDDFAEDFGESAMRILEEVGTLLNLNVPLKVHLNIGNKLSELK
ncbi:MAG TPA: hypothetical protein ENN64_01120, partial [bacterium]|nr:hypothetical protein [bacterium]